MIDLNKAKIKDSNKVKALDYYPELSKMTDYKAFLDAKVANKKIFRHNTHNNVSIDGELYNVTVYHYNYQLYNELANDLFIRGTIVLENVKTKKQTLFAAFPKFFNLDQLDCTEWSSNTINNEQWTDFKILKKLDGSLIGAKMTDTGQIVLKTQTHLINDADFEKVSVNNTDFEITDPDSLPQQATKLFYAKHYDQLLLTYLKQGYTFMFEYLDDHSHPITYTQDLVLTGARDPQFKLIDLNTLNIDPKFCAKESNFIATHDLLSTSKVDKTKELVFSDKTINLYKPDGFLDTAKLFAQLLKIAQLIQKEEGFVVHLYNKYTQSVRYIKFKTTNYFLLHEYFHDESGEAFYKNIYNIWTKFFNNELDDVLTVASQLNAEYKAKLTDMIHKVETKVHDLIGKTLEFWEKKDYFLPQMPAFNTKLNTWNQISVLRDTDPLLFVTISFCRDHENATAQDIFTFLQTMTNENSKNWQAMIASYLTTETRAIEWYKLCDLYDETIAKLFAKQGKKHAKQTIEQKL